MNDGDEVNDDISKKTKKEHLPYPKKSEKIECVRITWPIGVIADWDENWKYSRLVIMDDLLDSVV